MKQTENTEMVQTRLSPRDKARMQKRAREIGLSDAAYVRSLIIADLGRHAPKIAGPEVIA